MSVHLISESDTDGTVDIGDDDSDETIDLSLCKEDKGNQSLNHTQSLHEISDSDSESLLKSISKEMKDEHGVKTSLNKQSHSLHEISDSGSDVIPDTDSENGDISQSIKPKLKIHHLAKQRHKDKHKLSDSESGSEAANTNNSAPRKKAKRKSHEKPGPSHDGKPVDKRKRLSVYEMSTDELSSADEMKTRQKKPCPYGLKCYRKNPSHFEEFSHPKDEKTKHASPPTKKIKREHSSTSGVSTSRTSSTASEAASARKKPRNAAEVVGNAEPFNFLLTSVTGIPNEYNNTGALGIRGILSSCMGNLKKSAQVRFNYCIDVDWVVAQYPEQYRKLPLLIIHGSQRAEKADLDLAASKYDNVRMCQARMDMPYGTHHTKMMLLLYDSGLRVVIHTANLIHNDWHQKTQGMWISPLYPRLAAGRPAEDGDSRTHFKADLLQYLQGYRANALTEWIEVIKQHDMSATNVFLLASLPGRHTGDRKNAFGHLKLRKVLQQHGPLGELVRGWPVVGQFSSVGSLGASQDAWLCGEWLQSLSATSKLSAGLQSKAQLKLIFPSRDNVRCSLEGYPAGGSVPYSINTAKKQQYLHTFFHQWRSETRGRSRASPHIKTYTRMSADGQQQAWFICTSCNLSKAAWGALEKQQSQLMIRSYELGVLFLPSFLIGKKVFGQSDSKDLSFPLPYELPPTPYKSTDQPWIWDIPYMDKPDSHGNMWCPR